MILANRLRMKQKASSGSEQLLAGHGTNLGTASASAYRLTNYASEAFDGVITNVNGSFWQNTNKLPSWIKYDFGEGNSKVVTRYLLMPSGIYDSPENRYMRPYDFTFQGSNDDSNWTTLDTQTSQTYYDVMPFYSTDSLTLEPDFNEYALSNTTEYRYYRLYITEADPRGYYYYVAIGEMALYGY